MVKTLCSKDLELLIKIKIIYRWLHFLDVYAWGST